MNRCVSSTLHTCALSFSTPNAISADSDGDTDDADAGADADESPPVDDDASAAVAVAEAEVVTYPPSLTKASSSARPPV